jgi:hypothetical protein
MGEGELGAGQNAVQRLCLGYVQAMYRLCTGFVQALSGIYSDLPEGLSIGLKRGCISVW